MNSSKQTPHRSSAADNNNSGRSGRTIPEYAKQQLLDALCDPHGPMSSPTLPWHRNPEYVAGRPDGTTLVFRVRDQGVWLTGLATIVSHTSDGTANLEVEGLPDHIREVLPENIEYLVLGLGVIGGENQTHES